MTDGPDKLRQAPDASSGSRVESLVNRAIPHVVTRLSSASRPVLSERLTSNLVDAALNADAGRVAAALTDITHSGVPREEIVDYYIPEAARRLGAAWCADTLGFADVTIGSARLQRALRTQATEPISGPGGGGDASSVLVAAVPGEYHTLGAMVMTDQLRRQGLTVRLRLGDDPLAILRRVADGAFDAIFYSVAVAEKLAEVQELVERTRAVAPKPVPIFVGGAVLNSGLDVKKLTGADHATTDPGEAIRQCGLTISPHGARLRATSE